MRMTIHFMTIPGGIHGEDSLRELLLISLGFGLQGIMKLILLQNLYVLNIYLSTRLFMTCYWNLFLWKGSFCDPRFSFVVGFLVIYFNAKALLL